MFWLYLKRVLNIPVCGNWEELKEDVLDFFRFRSNVCFRPDQVADCMGVDRRVVTLLTWELEREGYLHPLS